VAVALVVAAGRGERLGSSGPKAFATLAGRPMLEWSLEALRSIPAVERVVVALPENAERPRGTVAVRGGATRSQSVRAALAAAGPGEPDDVVIVHDAARPLAEASLFERCLAELGDADAVVAAAPVTDTIKETGVDRVVERTLDRSRLWAVQTPQVFRRAALEQALSQPDEVLDAATDDAGLVEAQGGTVLIVPAPATNLKITTPVDLELAELLLRVRRAVR